MPFLHHGLMSGLFTHSDVHFIYLYDDCLVNCAIVLRLVILALNSYYYFFFGSIKFIFSRSHCNIFCYLDDGYSGL